MTMVLFSTPVNIQPAPFDLSFRDKILLAGSCFAEEIGGLLTENKFDVDVNPFGALYNPLSLDDALRRLASGKPYIHSDLFLHEGRYYSFAHHSKFSSADADTALKMMNDRIELSTLQLKECSLLIVTWGTAFGYRLKSGDGKVVANCHKLPAETFIREMLSIDEILCRWNYLLASLFALNPNLHLVLTVSPIRHLNDGAQGNQISKSTLIIAADRLRQSFPDRISYFPAYEIMMDELRDYRFYADDMLHPSRTAVEYIWEKFRNSYFSSETKTAYDAWQPIRKALRHVPFNPKSETYRKFVEHSLAKLESISEKYPFFDVSNERSLFQSILDSF